MNIDELIENALYWTITILTFGLFHVIPRKKEIIYI